ncbi:MAG: hypothetical protein JSR18_16380 [Proteobacteria bacterium]|nr:hypothetical protein [Pseudomonadota bacterium]
MDRVAFAFAFVLIVACGAVVAATGTSLPPLVASHFDIRGVADGFMPRVDYVMFMVALTTLLPLGIAASLAILPLVAPQWVNVRGAQAWLAGPQRAEAARSLAVRGAVLAMLLAVFLASVHLLVVAANRHQPPVLDAAPFIAALAAFLIATGLWALSLTLRFRRPPAL